MEDRGKVSVIVPLYNAGAFMTEAIVSIVKQTYSNLEIILIDDGSKDNTFEIAESLAKTDARIQVYQQENAGPGVARNNGIEAASGAFICFVDSDDRLEQNAVEKMIEAMDDDCDLVQCRAKKVYTDGEIDEEPWRTEEVVLTAYDAMVDYLYESKPIVRFAVWAKLIRRSAIWNVRFPELSNSEDVVFNAYLIDRCRKIKYIPDLLYYVTVREGSLSHSELTAKKIASGMECNVFLLKLIKSKEAYKDLLPRVYWTSVATIINDAFLIQKQSAENKNEMIRDLGKKCKELSIPRKMLTQVQQLIRLGFQCMPVVFAKIGQKVL